MCIIDERDFAIFEFRMTAGCSISQRPQSCKGPSYTSHTYIIGLFQYRTTQTNGFMALMFLGTFRYINGIEAGTLGLNSLRPNDASVRR